MNAASCLEHGDSPVDECGPCSTARRLHGDWITRRLRGRTLSGVTAEEVLEFFDAVSISVEPDLAAQFGHWFELGGREAFMNRTPEQRRETDRRIDAARQQAAREEAAREQAAREEAARERSDRLAAAVWDIAELADGLDEGLKSLLRVWVGHTVGLGVSGVQRVPRDHDDSPSVGAPGAATPDAVAPIVGDASGVVPSPTPDAPHPPRARRGWLIAAAALAAGILLGRAA